MPRQPGESSRERRLHEVIAAYLAAVEAGQSPDRDELLARHPDLAAELREFLVDHDRMRQAAGVLRPPGAPAPPRPRPRRPRPRRGSSPPGSATSAITSCWRRSAAAAWASSTGHGRGASAAWSPSR